MAYTRALLAVNAGAGRTIHVLRQQPCSTSDPHADPESARDSDLACTPFIPTRCTAAALCRSHYPSIHRAPVSHGSSSRTCLDGQRSIDFGVQLFRRSCWLDASLCVRERSVAAACCVSYWYVIYSPVWRPNPSFGVEGSAGSARAAAIHHTIQYSCTQYRLQFYNYM